MLIEIVLTNEEKEQAMLEFIAKKYKFNYKPKHIYISISTVIYDTDDEEIQDE